MEPEMGGCIDKDLDPSHVLSNPKNKPMKMKPLIFRLMFRRGRLMPLISLICMGVAGHGFSQTTYDWSSSAPDGYWKQGAAGARWSGVYWDQPPSNGILRFNNNHQLAMSNNVDGTYAIHGLVFGSSNTIARTIGGNTIRFYDFSGADPFIRNESEGNHVLNLNIEGDGTVGDPLKIQIANSGGLSFGGTLNNQGSFVDVEGGGSGSVVFTGVISGAGGFYKAGAGVTADLMVGNSYAGETILAAGILRAGVDDAFGTGGLALDGGTIASASGTARSFVNAVTRIGGNVTFGQVAGGTGSLVFGSTAATTLNGGTRTLSVLQATELRGALTNGSLTKEGAAVLTLNNGASSFGVLTVNAGSVALADSATVTGLAGAGGLQIASGKVLTVNGGTGAAFGGVISGQGGLVKQDSNKTLVLSGANTYSGGTTWGNPSGESAGGILSFGSSSIGGPGSISSGPLGTGTFTIRNKGSASNNYLQSSDGTARTISNAIVFAGSGSSANFGGTGDLTFDGTVNLGSGTRTLGVNNARTTFSGVVSGASDGAITKSEGGTLVLSANNSYGGKTTINAGRLQLGDGGNTGTAGGGAIELSGGTLVVNRSDAPTIANAVTASAGSNRFVEIAAGTSATFSGVVTGSGEFWKSGAGTLVLGNAANSFSNSIVIQADTLQVGSMAHVGGSGNLFIGEGGSGTFSYAGGGAESTGKLGEFALQGGTLNGIEIVNAGANLTVSSGIGESGGARTLTKSGAGTLTLAGANNYKGGTVVEAGALSVTGSLGTGTVTVKDGATLKGAGVIGGDVTIESGGTHAVGNSPGVQTVNGNLNYESGSIFDWELVSNLDGDAGDAGDTGVAGIHYDAVAGSATKTLTVESGAIFNVILNVGSAVDFSNGFWAVNQKWEVFSGFESVSGMFTLGSVTVDSQGKSSGLERPGGSFGFSSSGSGLALTWTVVPEPGGALAGILLAAGLLRRRRK